MRAIETIEKNAGRPWSPTAAVCLAAAMVVWGVASLRGDDDTVVDAAAEKRRESASSPQLIALDQQMDNMFFQGTRTADQLRQQSLGVLLLQVSALDGMCGLSAAQRAKCEVAARLDTDRSMDGIEAVRRRYGGRTVDLQNPAGQAEWQRFNQEGQAALEKLQQVGEGAGLLPRVIVGMLDDTQRSAWRRESELREQARWRSVVDAGMSQLDVALGLTSVQHEAIRTLLMEKPLRINHTKIWMQGNGGHFAPFVCRYGLAQLDPARLKPLLSRRQWKTLGQFIEQGKAMATHLKQQQMILE